MTTRFSQPFIVSTLTIKGDGPLCGSSILLLVASLGIPREGSDRGEAVSEGPKTPREAEGVNSSNIHRSSATAGAAGSEAGAAIATCRLSGAEEA